jgi:hypothetical protein
MVRRTEAEVFLHSLFLALPSFSRAKGVMDQNFNNKFLTCAIVGGPWTPRSYKYPCPKKGRKS